MWVHNAYHESKEDCSIVQELKEVVHQERVLLQTNWSSGGWKSELLLRPWMIAVQCIFFIITNPIYIYFERISIEFVYRPAFLLWKNTCCETCAVGDPRKLTAIRTKSEDLPLQL